uniref:Uncharacterized protein n=1 Tax=Arundo donax TaxID=35708 RepID=A0A0A9HBX6_ARUDO
MEAKVSIVGACQRQTIHRDTDAYTSSPRPKPKKPHDAHSTTTSYKTT